MYLRHSLKIHFAPLVSALFERLLRKLLIKARSIAPLRQSCLSCFCAVLIVAMAFSFEFFATISRSFMVLIFGKRLV